MRTYKGFTKSSKVLEMIRTSANLGRRATDQKVFGMDAVQVKHSGLDESASI